MRSDSVIVGFSGFRRPHQADLNTRSALPDAVAIGSTQYAGAMPAHPSELEPFDFPYDLLDRCPDPVAENLFAVDATDRLLTDMAAPEVREVPAGTVVVIGDRYGALTLVSSALGARGIRVHQDSYSGELALAANTQVLAAEAGVSGSHYANLPLGQSLVEDAQIVLMQLPKSLLQLEHWAALIARHAAPDVKVFAGGRAKHMTRAMNEVLEIYFEDVSASLARQKSRVLVAEKVRSGAPEPMSEPDRFFDKEMGLTVCSYPGVFAAGKVDIGTRFLAEVLRDPKAMGETSERLGENLAYVAADLGCGTGLLAATLLRELPDYRVIATDHSAAAVRSALATLELNVPDGKFKVRQDHLLSQQPDSSLDLIVCNPPFHAEAGVSTEIAGLLFEDAARALRQGGVMLTVYNSHLPHRRSLERLVGPTEQIARNPKFTVTRSTTR